MYSTRLPPAPSCTCAACCDGQGSHGCIRCVAATQACGGLASSEVERHPRLPRSVAPVCVGRGCNVCEECCRPPVHGEWNRANATYQCAQCEAERCPSKPTGRGHWHWHDDPDCQRHGRAVPRPDAYLPKASYDAGSWLHRDSLDQK